ncbi:MAG: hypothetical protein N2746_08595, partial [Deltaproteobacteria bacterium]|nr:hypothetical protein [Deltaproteobacteria bacterium]
MFRRLGYLFAFILASLFITCSSETEGDKVDGSTMGDSGIRTCKNTAQCRSDEECVNGVCVKRSPRDVGMDEVVEIPMDVGLDIG